MSGKIICNASPLIFLSKTGRIGLLNNLFGEVFIPEAAWNEAIHKPDDVTDNLKDLKSAGKLKVFTVKNTIAVSAMIGRLHKGESEVIVGAGELGIPYVILDDGYARSKAKQMELNVVGTLGIIVAAHKKGLVADVSSEIENLRKIGFRISDYVVEQIMKT
jgi:predicted nucleic acid-binding protein